MSLPRSPNPFANQQAWIWTARDGVQCLQPPRMRVLDNFIGTALATSEDGRIVGGCHSFGLEAESVIWIDREPLYLKDYLRANGVPDAFQGWVNTGFVTGVSRDGRMLVGYGAGPRDFQGFIVILPEDGHDRAGPHAACSRCSGVDRECSASAQSSGAVRLRRLHAGRRLEQHAPELTDLNVRGGFTWGFQVARFFTPQWGAEIVFTQQASALEAGTRPEPPISIASRWRSFTRTRVSIRRRRRAAAAVCVWRRRRHVLRGARSRVGHQSVVRIRRRHQVFSVGRDRLARAAPLQADLAQRRSRGGVCDPFGFCQGWLQPIEFTAGVSFASNTRKPAELL